MAERGGWGAMIGAMLVTVLIGTNLLTVLAWQREKALPAPSSSVSTPAAGNAAETPLANIPGIINGHDHLYRLEDFERYLPAADRMGIGKTLLVASNMFTIMGDKARAAEGSYENTEEMLRVLEKYPDKVIVFATLHPDDENKVEKLQEFVSRGAKGLKLYTGHGEYYDRPLLAEEMDPVYKYCEETGLPVCWHINMNNYGGEFTRALLRYPKLKVIIPHFGVGFYQPGGKAMQDLGAIMEAYPNVYTDISFGTRAILVAGMERLSDNVPAFRQYIEKYQDRIVWGTDMVITGNKEKTEEWCASVLRACREMMEKEEYHFWMAAEGSGYGDPDKNNETGRLNGLALPREILEKIYRTNLERFLEMQS